MKCKIKVIVYLVVIASVFSQQAFSQEEGRTEKGTEEAEAAKVEYITDTMAKGFKKALEEFDMQKTMQKSQKEQELIAALEVFIKQWIKEQQEKRKAELNKTIEQDWQALPSMPPQHFDYYLRDCSYLLQDKNIIAADSITYPYRASVIIRELLYVEQPPLIAEPRSKYQYTANNIIILALECSSDTNQWQAVDINQKTVSLNKGWPQEISQKLGLYFIPAY